MPACGAGVIFAGANQRWAFAHCEPGLQATSSHPSVTAGDVVAPVPPVFLVFFVERLFYWRHRVREGESQRVSIIRRIEAAFFHLDRKSTRLNSSHLVISYAVFCLKKKKKKKQIKTTVALYTHIQFACR